MSPRVVLVPLSGEIVRSRLASDDFRLECEVAGSVRPLHFGPDFPGAILPIYGRFLESLGPDGAVPGSYVVVDLDADEAVGQLGTKGPPVGPEIEIGYGMIPAVWGRGVATAAVQLLVGLLAGHDEIERVTARSAITNPASGRVLEKAGFRATGRETSDDDGELIVWVHPTR